MEIQQEIKIIEKLARRYSGNEYDYDKLYDAGIDFLLKRDKFRYESKKKYVQFIHIAALNRMKGVMKYWYGNKYQTLKTKSLIYDLGIEKKDYGLLEIVKRIDINNILYLRFWEENTQAETAKIIKRSQTYVCNMEKKLLERIKETIGD